MTPSGTCTECCRRFTGWALEQDTTCSECGADIYLCSLPQYIYPQDKGTATADPNAIYTGWKPLSGFVQENDPRYEEVEND